MPLKQLVGYIVQMLSFQALRNIAFFKKQTPIFSVVTKSLVLNMVVK